MESKWKVYGKKADFETIEKKYGIDKVVARIIRNRDVIGDENIDKYLNGGMECLYNPHLLKDADKAVDILMQKIQNGAKIRIIGDYDIDGVCSIYILLTGLKRVGADVDYVIPHRVNDGYGINEHLISDAHDAGIDTIITCDNGIAAMEQIEYGKGLGLTIIVTDHHDLRYVEDADGNREYVVPCADAVVNPKQNDCKYPIEGICGAVVAWKVVYCLYEKNNIPMSEWYSLVKYAAIATVGDVMELKDENRIIVKEGLKLINTTYDYGLSALMSVNGIEPGNLSAYHIGFIIGPCLNASGRLDTAKHSLELLCAASKEEGEKLAEDLKAYNDERKRLTAEFVEKSISIIENGPMINDQVLVVYLENCHESIAGIIAGRIREKFYRPVLVITDAETGLKGSGRSIEGYNMFEELLKCEKLLTKFGGHPMAAGLSLERENLEPLRQMLNNNAHLTTEELTPVLWIDVPMPIDYINEKLIDDLSVLEPFGNGNSKPVFADKNLFVSQINIIGKNRNVLKCVLTNSRGFKISALKFSGEEFKSFPFENGDIVSVTYYPSVNEYAGRKSLQIIIQEISRQG